MAERAITPQVRLVSLLLCLLTIATYLPVIQHEFINYDDPVYVTDNSHVQAGLTLESIIWAFTTGRTGNWHPLTWLSLMLDKELYGDWAGGFHLTNLLLHTANTLLLFVLLWSSTGAVWRSGFVAALFAVHPLHVESVAWVAERKDVLSTFFGLLTLLAYIKYACTHPTQRVSRRCYYMVALALFAFGLMSKAMLVSWPFVMLLLDYWPLGRIRFCNFGQVSHPSAIAENSLGDNHSTSNLRGQVQKLVLEKIPFLVMSLFISIVTVFLQGQTDSIASLRLIPLSNRLAQLPVSYMRYIGKTFWPADLAVFYPYKLIGWDSPTPYIAAVVLVAITVATLAWVRRWPFFVTGWFWFIGTLIPVIGLIQVGRQSIADRYTYIPSIGIFIMFVWGINVLVAVSHLVRILCVSACIVLVSGACFATRHQLQFWQNSKSLFQHALRVTDRNDVAHNNLGSVLVAEGELEAARQQFEAALLINPDHYWAKIGLGYLLVRAGQVEEGLTLLQSAVAAWPTVTAYCNLGTVLLETGQYSDAVAYLQVAVKLQPDFFNARMNLGAALTYLGNFNDALTHFIAAVKLRPNNPDAQFNLGAASAALGKLDLATTALLKCIELRPQEIKARRLLVDVALKQHNITAAITNLVELVALEPDAATAFDLAQLLVQCGRADSAVAYYQLALKLDPDSPKTLNNLALILATHPDERVRNGAEAVALAERACAITKSQVPVYLSTLAAAYAEAGRFDDAIRTAEQARALAEAAGQTNLANRNAELLQLYRAGKPFHDPALGPLTATP